jgi:outer membrane protein assembly factor BamB
LYAVNWTTGKIQWKYESPNNPYETPYVTENGTAVSSWNGGILVADGKVYDYNTEHSPTQPITRGWKLHCVNATTGEGIWNITAMSGSRDFRGAIADGYLAFDNFYDGFMYVFGKGKSATTVTASPKTAVEGAPVLIEGTVLDLSPAQPNTPCVSQDSISTQMEFLHMQMPIDGIWHDIQMTGVPVMLTAINSKGEYIDIGEVTTNAYYGTFQKAWMPPADDTYEIIASFGGDASYGNSAASTAVSVSVAPEVPDTNNNPVETDALSPSEFYNAIALATVAIIVAIAAIGLLLLRKR